MEKILETLQINITFLIIATIYLIGFWYAIRKTNRVFKVLEYLMKLNELRLNWLFSFGAALFGYGLCVIWPISIPMSSYYISKYNNEEDEDE